jgi:TonB family protein
MLLEALAAAVLAAASPTAGASAAPGAAPSAGASTVSPVTVTAPPRPNAPPAATVEVPSDDSRGGHWASVWPENAYKAGIAGHVVLSCDIDRDGLAEWCKVAAETPPKMGFGAAALELRPTLKLKPATGPDGPIDQVMNVAIEFKPPAQQIDWGSGRSGGSMGDSSSGLSSGAGGDMNLFGPPALKGRPVSMLNNPVWASTVSYADLVHAYPAKGGGGEGYAVAHCSVNRDGSLTDCLVIKEDPEKRGFGEAALSLARRFRVAPEWTTAPHHADVWVDVPIRFPAPGAPDDRTVRAPYWVAGFDPDQALKVFPQEAADRGLTSGYGVARCVVAKDGRLTACSPQPADPEGLGFSEAAVKLAATMRMNPWLTNGEPVDGTLVELGVRLSLKSDK